MKSLIWLGGVVVAWLAIATPIRTNVLALLITPRGSHTLIATIVAKGYTNDNVVAGWPPDVNFVASPGDTL